MGRSLQTRFYLGLAAIVLVLCLFLGFSLYLHMRDLLYSEVTSKANLVFNQVDAVQNYVRKSLRPKMYDILPQGDFILEAMSSSFVSRQVMVTLNQSNEDHVYRRVAIGARNPDSEAQGLELELVRYFKDHPQQGQWAGYKKLDGREFFIKARPVVFKKSCLICHGDPHDAPQALIERYGPTRGFGKKLSQLAGLDLVGVPLEGSLNEISGATVSYLILYLAGMILLYFMIQFFFSRVVATKLKHLSNFYRERFDDLAEPQVLTRLDKGDEVDEMVQGIEELGDKLHSARRQLQEHAENLEVRVEERTQELRHEVDERKNDVRLFIGLLDGLHQSDSIPKLLGLALERIAHRFKLRAIEYQCTFSNIDHYSWPDPSIKTPIPRDILGKAVDNQPSFLTGEAFIPVTSYQENVQGVLYIRWPEHREIALRDQELMLALGQQLGIAIENIRSLRDLLMQRDTLQSIFEGISDPMALLDGNGRVLVANRAAKDPGSGDIQDEQLLQGLLQSSGLFSEDKPLHQVLDGKPFNKEVSQANGREFRLTLYPLTASSGSSDRIVAYIREITDEKRIIAQMQQNERLVSVGKLAAGLAHEMNNPLGVILCYADLLDQSLRDDQQRQDLKVINRHAKQAHKVLGDLLNFARSKPPVSGHLEVREVVSQVGQIFTMQAGAKKVRLEISQATEPMLIYGNSQALEQILTNLLLNALDAVEPGEGVIKLETGLEPETGSVLISVSDNGSGIPPEHMSRIFDPFYSTKDVGQGTGLGLAVVYGLMSDMGGEIEAASRNGAVFSLRFPTMERSDSNRE